MDLVAQGSLTFEAPDLQRFPCLQLAYDALEVGGSAGCVLNAANEVAVYAFLDGRIAFTAIPEVILRTLDKMELVAEPSLDGIVEIDQVARSVATEQLSHV